jgi:hypothetical protein
MMNFARRPQDKAGLPARSAERGRFALISEIMPQYQSLDSRERGKLRLDQDFLLKLEGPGFPGPWLHVGAF